MDQWRLVTVPIPPEPEQSAPSQASLTRRRLRLTPSSPRSGEGIEKLKEYRTALISAAVTGKIDVREEISSRMADSPERNGASTE